ncbi:MAG TPA: DUF4261 domain-containing protein [Saprospiraceae bacterium]|nr:DUF4261 domain-containing protein [Saprospiraceae bacterium]
MGLFSFFSKKEGSGVADGKSKVENPIILSMVMYNSPGTFDFDKMVKELASNWRLQVKEPGGESGTHVFKINGEMISIMTMDAPIPWSDIEGTGRYAHNWEGWEKDLEHHTSHLIVSLFPGSNSIMERNLLFTKVIASILSTSDGLGVYSGSRSLLIPKQLYLNSANGIKNKALPVELWVYVGFRQSDTGNGVYTYGLKTFGKKEMEIVDSDKSLEELYGLLHGLVFYVVSRDITFGDGHTFNLPDGATASIKETDGKYVNETVLRLMV